MEQRAIIAIALSILVLMGYQYMFAPVQPSRNPQTQNALQESPQPTSDNVLQSIPSDRLDTQAPVVVDDQPERLIKVETNTIKAVISTKGAVIRSWKLKNHTNQAGSVSEVELVPPMNSLLENSYNAGGATMPDRLSYVPDREVLIGQGVINFTAVRTDGLTVKRSYGFSEDGYKVKVFTSYQNNSPSALTEAPSAGLLVVSKAEDRQNLYHELAYMQGKEVKRLYPDDFKDEKIASGTMEWVFLGDKYFFTALIPGTSPLEVYSRKINDELYSADIKFQPLQMASGESKTLEYEIYFGPKDVDILKAAGNKLERTIDLGFFDLLAYPLLLCLKWMYSVIPNYGYVIIIATVFIKVIFYPLSQKSYKSMKDMQKVAPLMEQLREKYKDDKERMNREIIELYKRYKVNPLGGCLPMLLQMPVFFALYTVLNGAVELRHAPFIFWIQDLSAKDPFYITPVLMGATMFIQQKMTPSSADPMQQKIMMLTPLIFTVMFLNFSSGLVLYWLINNVLSIAQQYYVNRDN